MLFSGIAELQPTSLRLTAFPYNPNKGAHLKKAYYMYVDLIELLMAVIKLGLNMLFSGIADLQPTSLEAHSFSI